MTEKVYYAKSELIAERLKAFPSERDSPDLEHNALAGYVDCMNGLFLHYRDFELIRRTNEKEISGKTETEKR